MEPYSMIRIIHIACGSVALLTGPVAMFNQNGGKLHRKSGMIYFIAMLVVVSTAFVMSAVKSNMFLFMIAAFTFYLVSTAYRALKLKKLHLGQKAGVIDWFILVVSAFLGIALLIWGCYVLFVVRNSFGITAIVFSSIMLRGIIRDIKRFTKRPTDKNHWLYIHIGNMIGGYIATSTAFLVNNVHFEPAFIVWLLPTVILGPVLILTIKKFKTKSAKKAPLNFERTYE